MKLLLLLYLLGSQTLLLSVTVIVSREVFFLPGRDWDTGEIFLCSTTLASGSREFTQKIEATMDKSRTMAAYWIYSHVQCGGLVDWVTLFGLVDWWMLGRVVIQRYQTLRVKK